MKISLTQLQSYNIVYKLLNNYYDKTKDEDMMSLLPSMLFWNEQSTADPAIWGEWLEAINNKKKLTKEEAFDGMIKFLEIYYMLAPYSYVKTLLSNMYSAKDCNDSRIPVVKQWNTHLKEVLQEPKGSRMYLWSTKK